MAGYKVRKYRRPNVATGGIAGGNGGGDLAASDALDPDAAVGAGDSGTGGSADPGGYGGADAGTAPKRRGRPPGSGNSAATSRSNVGGIEQSLFEIHALLATFTFPEMALEQEEARSLAVALSNVQQHYPGVKLLSDKHMALVSLGMVSTRIYGKRVIAVVGKPVAAKPGGQTQRAPAQAAPIVVQPLPPSDPSAELGKIMPAEAWFMSGSEIKQ